MLEINRNPSRKHLRQFAVASLVMGALLLLKAAFFSGGTALATILLAMGLIGVIFPVAMKYPYLFLSVVTFPIGFVVSYLVLSIMYFALITPVALVMRLCGRDSLRLKKGSELSTYYVTRRQVTDLSYYLNQ